MSTKRHHRPRPRGQVHGLAWEYPAGYRVPPHSHDAHQLVHATSGVMSITTPNGTYVVPTHRAVWVPAKMVHGIEMSGAVSMRTLYLSPRLPTRMLDECRVVSMSALLRELVLHIVARGHLDRRARGSRALIEVLLDLLCDLPAHAVHLPEPRDARARRVASHLREHPADRRSLAELALEAGGSKRTLERAFCQDTGMTFGRWRQQVRLVHALRLLAAGQAVTSVALDVGYESPSAFVLAFRRSFGVTPGKYYAASPPSA